MITEEELLDADLDWLGYRYACNWFSKQTIDKIWDNVPSSSPSHPLRPVCIHIYTEDYLRLLSPNIKYQPRNKNGGVLHLFSYLSPKKMAATASHSHDGLASHSHAHEFNAAEHGHSHETLDGPGSFASREMPLIAGRDWNERAFTVGIGG